MSFPVNNSSSTAFRFSNSAHSRKTVSFGRFIDGGANFRQATAIGTYHSLDSVIVQNRLQPDERSDWFKFRTTKVRQIGWSVYGGQWKGSPIQILVKGRLFQDKGGKLELSDQVTSKLTTSYVSLKSGVYYLQLSRQPQSQDDMNTGISLIFS
jgi:hypothetical protein